MFSYDALRGLRPLPLGTPPKVFHMFCIFVVLTRRMSRIAFRT